MTPRTVQADDGTEWTLSQALIGTDDERAATETTGTVPVVATPSGGAQSVRLALAADWAETDDAALLGAIAAAAPPD